MKKIVYVSLPMSGCESTIWERYTNSVKELRSIPGYENCEIVNPESISNFDPSNGAPGDPASHSWGWYMGRDIETIYDRGCTDMFMCENWRESRGCRVEHEVASVLGINILYNSADK